MKNVSKLALFVAAGMMTAGAQAATIEIADGTSMELGGVFEGQYVSQDTVNSSSTVAKNEDDLGGVVKFETAAVRSFENFNAYVEATFQFDTLDDGSSLGSDGAVFGLEGDFGQIEAGDSDSVYEDLITDSLDFFEQADLGKAEVEPDEETMLTYYSPSIGGLSFNLQAAIQDESDGAAGTTRDAEEAFLASAAYDFGAGALHIGYNDRGFNTDSSDEVIGLAAVFGLGDSAEVAIKHEMQTEAGADTDFTGIGLAFDYGMGNIYGAYQNVSPDGGDDKSQYAVGIDTEIEDGFKLYAEMANFDGQAANDADSLFAVGVIYGF